MVVLRLSRQGKKGHATFRIVVSDKKKDTIGTQLEIIGTYDPHQTPTRIELKEDRVKYWLSVGAKPSDTVHNLLVEKGVISEAKRVVAKAPKQEEKPADAPKAESPTPEPKAEAPTEEGSAA